MPVVPVVNYSKKNRISLPEKTVKNSQKNNASTAKNMGVYNFIARHNN